MTALPILTLTLKRFLAPLHRLPVLSRHSHQFLVLLSMAPYNCMSHSPVAWTESQALPHVSDSNTSAQLTLLMSYRCTRRKCT